jgi:hypothetical protein
MSNEQRVGFASRQTLTAGQATAERSKREEEECKLKSAGLLLQEAGKRKAEEQARKEAAEQATKAKEEARSKKAKMKARMKAEDQEKARMKAEEKAKKAKEKAKKAKKAVKALEVETAIGGALPEFFSAGEQPQQMVGQPEGGAAAGFNWQQEALVTKSAKAKVREAAKGVTKETQAKTKGGAKARRDAQRQGAKAKGASDGTAEQQLSPSWAEAAAHLNEASANGVNNEAQSFKMPPKLNATAPAFTLPKAAGIVLDAQAEAGASAETQQEFLMHAEHMFELNRQAQYVAQYREEQIIALASVTANQLRKQQRLQQARALKRAQSGEEEEEDEQGFVEDGFDWICHDCTNMNFSPKSECQCGARRPAQEQSQASGFSASQCNESYLPPNSAAPGEHSTNPTTRDALLRIAKLASARDKQMKEKSEKKDLIAHAINSQQLTPMVQSLQLQPSSLLQPSPPPSTTAAASPHGGQPLASLPHSRDTSFDAKAADTWGERVDTWGELLPVDSCAGGAVRKSSGAGLAPAQNPWSMSGASAGSGGGANIATNVETGPADDAVVISDAALPSDLLDLW